MGGRLGRVSIHDEHPFAVPESERDPLRRWRGRLPQPVTVWTTGTQRSREGWTLSSVLVADGDPGEVIGLLDEDSDLADALGPGTPVTVNLLAGHQSDVADAFARVGPAPGGVFRTGTWRDGSHGPELLGAQGWIRGRLAPQPIDHAGWALLVRVVVEEVEVDPVADSLIHRRGRYRAAEPD